MPWGLQTSPPYPRKPPALLTPCRAPQVQALYTAVLRLLGSPADVAAAQQAFEATAAWGASVELLLVAQVGRRGCCRRCLYVPCSS